MRRLRISLALSLLLLVAQHGAVLHELSHVVRLSTADVSVHAGVLGEKYCELCLGYSQLGHGASHSPSLFQFDLPTGPIHCNSHYPATPADVPTARSRGPPVLKLNS